MTRITKQFFYGLFYFAVLAGVCAIVYFGFLRPAPGCTNNRQDVGEEGIDCGGTCALVCVPEDIRAIEIPEPVWIFKSRANTVELLAKIQNPNLGFSARTFDYQINLFDAGDALVASVPGSSYLYAGEIKYLTAIRDGISYADTVVRAEVVITNPDWLKDIDFRRPVLGGVENFFGETARGMMTVSGRVTNRDTMTLTRAHIVAVFMNTYGTPIGVSSTEIDGLTPNEQRPFSVLHPDVPGSDVQKTQIYVYGLRP
jgi:hypothetical protein